MVVQLFHTSHWFAHAFILGRGRIRFFLFLIFSREEKKKGEKSNQI
jgi:hypothetical protein